MTCPRHGGLAPFDDELQRMSDFLGLDGRAPTGETDGEEPPSTP